MSMMVGTCWVNIHIPGMRSLKDKRRIIKSLKVKLQNSFNISIAEVGAQDQWQRTEFGIACVGNDRAFIDRVMSKIRDRLVNERHISVIDYDTEIIQ